MASQKLYRFSLQELVPDDMTETQVDLSQLNFKTYPVKASDGEIYSVNEIQNEGDVWRTIDRDLLSVTYTNCKINLFDIVQQYLIKVID